MGGNESVSVLGYNIGGGVRGEGCDEPKVDPNIVRTESYVTITWEDFSNVSRVLLTFTVEHEVTPLHTSTRTCSK